MKLFHFLPFFALLCFFASSFSQVKTITGKVTDKKTKESLAFVSVGIEGTNLGTITDFNGEFTMKIGDNYKNGTLNFINVGYEKKLVEIGKFTDNEKMSIELHSIDFKLNTVTITEKSMAVQKILKTVIQNISNNYFVGEINYNLFYKQ